MRLHFITASYILWTLNFNLTLVHNMQNGDTPLLMAVQNGHLAVVKMLIEKYQCSANEVYKVRDGTLLYSAKFMHAVVLIGCTLALLFNALPCNCHQFYS